MLEHDTRERAEGRVEIEDLAPDTARALIRYIYTEEVVEKFKDASGGSPMGLDQTALWEDGGNYLKSLPVQPDKIVKLEVVKPKK